MKNSKPLLFYMLTALLISEILSALMISHNSHAQEKSQKHTVFIEAKKYIRQDFLWNQNGFLQSKYTDETGSELKLQKKASNTKKMESQTKYKAKNTVSPSAVSLSTPAPLPSSYDLRSTHMVTSVKDQKGTGCCWAFSVLKSLESNLLKKKLAQPDTLDLSENHLTWYLYHPAAPKSGSSSPDGISFYKPAIKEIYQKQSAAFRKNFSFSTYYNCLPYLNGGNALFGAFVLARWTGAVHETKAPFTAKTDKQVIRMGKKMKRLSGKLRNKKNYLLTDAICYDEAKRTAIQAAVMEQGAMSVSLYFHPSFGSKNRKGELSYCQIKYKTNAASYANHCVTIIGWDDNYPKKNFKHAKPKKNGAWLAENSYGTSFGKKGYFWISYEEPSLTDFYSFCGTSADTYDKNYQYDGSGWTIALAPQNKKSSKAANIFKADKEYTQCLKAVSLYTATNNQKYTITIYQNVKKNKPESGKKAMTVRGTEKYRGYHTISLPHAVTLKAGKRFSIVISYHSTSSSTGYLPLEGASIRYGILNLRFYSKDGESFYFSAAKKPGSKKKKYTWLDLNQTPIRTGKNTVAIYHNACIKAFTVPAETD